MLFLFFVRYHNFFKAPSVLHLFFHQYRSRFLHHLLPIGRCIDMPEHIGPQIPEQLRERFAGKHTEENAIESRSESDDDAYCPDLPPDMVGPVKNDSVKSKGKQPIRVKGNSQPAAAYYSDSDDDFIGPPPPPQDVDADRLELSSKISAIERRAGGHVCFLTVKRSCFMVQ